MTDPTPPSADCDYEKAHETASWIAFNGLAGVDVKEMSNLARCFKAQAEALVAAHRLNAAVADQKAMMAEDIDAEEIARIQGCWVAFRTALARIAALTGRK